MLHCIVYLIKNGLNKKKKEEKTEKKRQIQGKKGNKRKEKKKKFVTLVCKCTSREGLPLRTSW